MSIREFPGRITDIEWNQLCRYGLQKAVDRIILKSGSEYQVIDGNYGNIMYSGSNYDTVRNSMTGSLTGLVADRVGMAVEGYENGTIRNSVCLTGSLIYSTLITTVALIAPYVTGSIIVSGSNVYGENAKFTNITGSQISISGNAYVDGTISGSLVSDDVTAESVTAKYITGSTLVSGSVIAGQTGNIVNVNSTSVIATTVTGSTLVSGSTVAGRNGNFTNINATNITGSILSGSNIYSPSAKITNVNATNITGSSITGSNIYGSTGSITNITCTDLYATRISGSLTSVNINYPFTYLIRITGSNYEAINRYGTLEFGGENNIGGATGSDCSNVVQSCLDYYKTLETPIKLQFGEGTFTLLRPITVNNNGTCISGISPGGDLHFSNYGSLSGLYDRFPTTFIANGINAFEIGNTDFCFGITFENFGIHGTVSDAAQDDDVYSSGSGIRIFKSNTLRFKDIQVQRKEYGFKFETTGSFDTLNVIDVVFLNNILLTYNVYGIYQSEWLANVRAENIFGYINQKSLIRCDSQIRYDARFRNIYSNADSWNAVNDEDAPLSFCTSRDLHLDGVSIYGGYGSGSCPTPLMYLYLTKSGAPEFHRAYVRMSDITLEETDEEGILIEGDYGMVVIRDLYAGSTGTQSWTGGSGEITKQIVNNVGTPETEYYVYGGLAQSQLATKSDWFVGAMVVRDVGNYPMKNGGTDISSGNGTDDTVIIAHSLVTTPTKYGATAASSDARLGEIRGVVADATNLTVYFANALTNGTNNISINWWAEADKPVTS